MAKHVKFTAATLAALLPGPDDASLIYWDKATPGLGCRVTVVQEPVRRVRRKLFLQLRYGTGASAKQLKQTFGSVEQLAATDAQFMALLARVAQLKADAATEKRNPLVVEKLRTAEKMTFGAFAADYLATTAPKHYADGGAMAERCLGRAVKAFGELYLDEVKTVDHIEALRDKVARDVGPCAANRTVAHIGALYKEARRRELTQRWPTRGITKIADVPRTAVLLPEEAQRLFAAISAAEAAMPQRHGLAPEMYGDCLRIAMLTGCRRSEATGMRWDEIEGGQWARGASRNKNRTATRTPLSARAQSVIDRCRARKAENAWMRRGLCDQFVFPSARAPTGHITEMRAIFTKAVEIAGLEDKGLVMHDLRAVQITLLLSPKAGGLTPQQVKAVTGHKTDSAIKSVYARFEEHPDLKAALAITDDIWGGA